VKNPENVGQTASLARAVTLARAELLARIDADDVFLPNKLAPHVRFMEAHPDVAVCGTAAVKLDERSRPVGRFVPPLSPGAIRFRLLRGVPICHVSALMRRRVVLEAGNYDPCYRYAADFALWSALAARGAALANLPATTVAYREYATSTGAALKVGRAGDESAEIIQRNWRFLAGTELDEATARSLDLLLVPEAPLTGADRVRAVRVLLEAGERAFAPLAPSARRQMMHELAWGLAKAWSTMRERGESSRVRAEYGAAWAEARRWGRARPWVGAAYAASLLGSRGAEGLRRAWQDIGGAARRWLA